MHNEREPNLDGYDALANAIIACAINDLQSKVHRESALAWLHGADGGITFQQCCALLGVDSDAIREGILYRDKQPGSFKPRLR